MAPEKDLNRLRRLPENRVCPNCFKEESLGFTAVCMTYKTFICGDCKSAHQSFSHRTKSVSFSNWTAEEVKSLDEKHGGGNRMALATYLLYVPEGERPGKDATLDAYKRFIERAYIQKLFIGESVPVSGSQSAATSSAASRDLSPTPSGHKERRRRHKHERSSSTAPTPKPAAASDAWDRAAELTPSTPGVSPNVASASAWESPVVQGRSRRSKERSSRHGSSKTRRDGSTRRDSTTRSRGGSAATSEASPALSSGRSFCETQAPSHMAYGAVGGDFSFGPAPPMAGPYGPAVSATVAGGCGSLHAGHASPPWQSPPVAQRVAPLEEHGPQQLMNPWAETLHPAFPHAWHPQIGHVAQPAQGMPVSAAELSRLRLQEADFATNPWAGEVASMLGAVASRGVGGVSPAPRAAQPGYVLQAANGGTTDHGLRRGVLPQSALGTGRWQGLAHDFGTSKALVGAC